MFSGQSVSGRKVKVKIEFSRPKGSNRTQPLFSFVVVADTHINETDDGSSSPFLTNRLANERARFVFQQIAQLQTAPDFVVHLGDIVHPVPGLPSFDDAVKLFHEIASPLSVPLHVIPGNHDVGDKRVSWMPADQVCDEYLASYRNAFGADYYAFDKGPVRFVMLNSLLLNSGLADEKKQADWFERELEQNAQRRVFVFMHYPPFIYQPDERGNYDNIDQPARRWLVECLERPHVEAIFAGHVHNYWYDNIGDGEMYMLPSTAFVRHDFSEFYRVAPSLEFARGDLERFGYFWVDVFADDEEAGGAHVAYSIRTMGGQCRRGERIDSDGQIWLSHPKTSALDQIGVELRHPWAESMQIASTGGVQEFGRKWARNDYPLLALTEMGVRLCKVPDIDLAENESRNRMAILAGSNHRFIVTALGVPHETLLENDLLALGVESFEVNATAENFSTSLERLRQWRKQAGVDIYYSKILANDDSRFDGKQFTHFVKSGFTGAELAEHRDSIVAAIESDAIDGITIRHEFDDPLAPLAAQAMAFADAAACRVMVSIKLAAKGVAQLRDDDSGLAALVAEAMVLSRVHERVSYVFDTFMDVDRGYYPRHAFIDRRFNPRVAATTFAMLNALLSSMGRLSLTSEADHKDESTRQLHFEASAQRYVLVVVPGKSAASTIGSLGPLRQVYDLISAQCHPPEFFRDFSGIGDGLMCLLCELAE